MEIKLPETLNVHLEDSPVPAGRPWHDPVPTFIVLSFGRYEVTRWEWQADRPLDSRTSPDESDAEEFVAGKLRELLAPAPAGEEVPRAGTT